MTGMEYSFETFQSESYTSLHQLMNTWLRENSEDIKKIISSSITSQGGKLVALVCYIPNHDEWVTDDKPN